MYGCITCGHSPAGSYSNLHVGSWNNVNRIWFPFCMRCAGEHIEWMEGKGDMKEYRITVFMKDKSVSPVGAIISQATITGEGKVRIAKWCSPKKLLKKGKTRKFKRLKGWNDLLKRLAKA